MDARLCHGVLRTVKSCAPFVPIYSEKPHAVDFFTDDNFLTGKRCDGTLGQYFLMEDNGYRCSKTRGP
jgi:hypothetical protein